MTVSKRGGTWFVSFQTRQKCLDTKHTSESEVDIDASVKKLATLSNGEKICSINASKGIEQRLAIQQQRLARKG